MPTSIQNAGFSNLNLNNSNNNINNLLNAFSSTHSLNEMDLQQQQQHGPHGDQRTMQLAMELALLQQPHVPPQPQPHVHYDLPSPTSSHPGLGGLDPNNPLLHPYGISGHGGHHTMISSCNGMGGSLEDLKMRRSQNMTECVPVPTSEHVAEIVGRQGCKIKALRAKTNTYIKTPVRGEEPVFVVTGRKEDVALAKREILSAADHFSQIRASRSKNSGINSTLAFGQLVANQPGQTTTQVRVPYRVVGLVVGPKGATIKRIQQQTHTYIVTPSRDKEPVFEVTGLPENVDAARKEIEAHIALRTGTDGNGIGNIYGIGGDGLDNNTDSLFGSSSTNNYNNGHSLERSNSILNNGDSAFSSLSSSVNGKALTLQSLIDGGGSAGNFDIHSQQKLSGINNRPQHTSSLAAWSNGTDSHDSGVGGSPPFDSLGNSSSSAAAERNNGTGIWGELNKVLGSLDLNSDASSLLLNGLNNSQQQQQQQQQHQQQQLQRSEFFANSPNVSRSFMNVGSRSSLDLGTLGRPSLLNGGSNGSSHNGSTTSNTATPPNTLLLSSGDASPPNSLPPFGNHHRLIRASVSSEPNGIFSAESVVGMLNHPEMSAAEAAAVKAASDLAAFSSSVVLSDNDNHSEDNTSNSDNISIS